MTTHEEKRERRGMWIPWLVIALLVFSVLSFFPGPLSVMAAFLPLIWLLRSLGLARGDQHGWLEGQRQVLLFTEPDPRDELSPKGREIWLPRLLRGVLLGLGTVPMFWAGGVLRLWEIHPYLDDLLLALEVVMIFTAFTDITLAISWALGSNRQETHRAACVLAPSLRRFWGKGWNLYISGLLKRAVFDRAGGKEAASRAVFLCFVVSGAFHGLPQMLAAGPLQQRIVLAVSAFAFFPIHGLALALERSLASKLAGPAGRAYLYAVFLLTLPLYPAPLCAALGVHDRPWASVTVVWLFEGMMRGLS